MTNIFDDIGNGIGSVFEGIGNAFSSPFQPQQPAPEPQGFVRAGADTPQATLGAPRLLDYEAPSFQGRSVAPTPDFADTQTPAAPPQPQRQRIAELPQRPQPPSAVPPDSYNIYANPISETVHRVLDPTGYEVDRQLSWAKNTQPVYAAQVQQYEHERKIQGQQLAAQAASGSWEALDRLYREHPDVYKSLDAPGPNGEPGVLTRAMAPYAPALDLLSNQLAAARTPEEMDRAVRTTARQYPEAAAELAKHSGTEWRARLGLLRDLSLKGQAYEQNQEAVRRELSGFTMAPKDVREANAETFMTPGGHAFAAPMVYDKRTGQVGINISRALTRNQDGSLGLKDGVALIAPKDIDALAKDYRQTGKDTLDVYQDVKRLQEIMNTTEGDKGPWKKQHVVDVLARVGAGGKATKWNVVIGEEGQSWLMRLRNQLSKQTENDPLSPETKQTIRDFLNVVEPGIGRAIADEVAPFARRAGAGNVPLSAIFGKNAAGFPELRAEYDEGRKALLDQIKADPNAARTGLLTQDTVIPRDVQQPVPLPAAGNPPPPAPPAAPPGNSGGFSSPPRSPTAGGPSPNYENKVLQIESRGDFTARSPMSSAYGGFQFTRATGAKYGVLPGATPDQQRAGFRRLTADNAEGLRRAGLPVDDTTLYMAHQQGLSGAQKLLTASGGSPAADIVGRRAAANNPAFFYEGGDTRKRPLTVDEVKAKFASKIGGAVPASEIGTGRIAAGSNAATPAFVRLGVDTQGNMPPEGTFAASRNRMLAEAPVTAGAANQIGLPQEPEPFAPHAITGPNLTQADLSTGAERGNAFAHGAASAFGAESKLAPEFSQAAKAHPILNATGRLAGDVAALSAGVAALGPAGLIAAPAIQGALKAKEGERLSGAAEGAIEGAIGAVVGKGLGALGSALARSSLGQWALQKFANASPEEVQKVARAGADLLDNPEGPAADAARAGLKKMGVDPVHAMHVAIAERMGAQITGAELQAGKMGAQEASAAVGVPAAQAGALSSRVATAAAEQQAGYAGVAAAEAAAQGGKALAREQVDQIIGGLRRSLTDGGFVDAADSAVLNAASKFENIAAAAIDGDPMRTARALRVFRSETLREARGTGGMTVQGLNRVADAAHALWGRVMVGALGSDKGGQAVALLRRSNALTRDLKTVFGGSTGDETLKAITALGDASEGAVVSFLSNASKAGATTGAEALNVVNTVKRLAGSDTAALDALRQGFLKRQIGAASTASAVAKKLDDMLTGPNAEIVRQLFTPEQVQRLSSLAKGGMVAATKTGHHWASALEASIWGAVMLGGHGATGSIAGGLLGPAAYYAAKTADKFFAQKLAGLPVTWDSLANAGARPGAVGRAVQGVTGVGATAIGETARDQIR
jgi:hypothetical protein